VTRESHLSNIILHILSFTNSGARVFEKIRVSRMKIYHKVQEVVFVNVTSSSNVVFFPTSNEKINTSCFYGHTLSICLSNERVDHNGYEQIQKYLTYYIEEDHEVNTRHIGLSTTIRYPIVIIHDRVIVSVRIALECN
jgi:hypothetical protein